MKWLIESGEADHAAAAVTNCNISRRNPKPFRRASALHAACIKPPIANYRLTCTYSTRTTLAPDLVHCGMSLAWSVSLTPGHASTLYSLLLYDWLCICDLLSRLMIKWQMGQRVVNRVAMPQITAFKKLSERSSTSIKLAPSSPIENSSDNVSSFNCYNSPVAGSPHEVVMGLG